MQPFKAVVKNGRLVVDEPTELPEGTEIELFPVGDDFAPRSRLACFKPSTRDSETSIAASRACRSSFSARKL
jgi:hypothetical protein